MDTMFSVVAAETEDCCANFRIPRLESRWKYVNGSVWDSFDERHIPDERQKIVRHIIVRLGFTVLILPQSNSYEYRIFPAMFANRYSSCQHSSNYS